MGGVEVVVGVVEEMVEDSLEEEMVVEFSEEETVEVEEVVVVVVAGVEVVGVVVVVEANLGACKLLKALKYLASSSHIIFAFMPFSDLGKDH